MSGFERLNKMLKEWLEKDENNKEDEAFIETVNYLLDRKDLEPKFLNEEKNLDDLYNFIHSKGQSHNHNGWCYIKNEVVFSWAIMYFTLPNELLKIKPLSPTKSKTTSKDNVISFEKINKKATENKQSEQLSFLGGSDETGKD